MALQRNEINLAQFDGVNTYYSKESYYGGVNGFLNICKSIPTPQKFHYRFHGELSPENAQLISTFLIEDKLAPGTILDFWDMGEGKNNLHFLFQTLGGNNTPHNLEIILPIFYSEEAFGQSGIASAIGILFKNKAELKGLRISFLGIPFGSAELQSIFADLSGIKKLEVFLNFDLCHPSAGSNRIVVVKLLTALLDMLYNKVPHGFSFDIVNYSDNSDIESELLTDKINRLKDIVSSDPQCVQSKKQIQDLRNDIGFHFEKNQPICTASLLNLQSNIEQVNTTTPSTAKPDQMAAETSSSACSYPSSK